MLKFWDVVKLLLLLVVEECEPKITLLNLLQGIFLFKVLNCPLFDLQFSILVVEQQTRLSLSHRLWMSQRSLFIQNFHWAFKKDTILL